MVWTNPLSAGTLVVKKVFNGFIGSSATPINMHQYATALIQIGNLDNTSPTMCLYQWVDSATSATIDQGLLSADNLLGGLQPSWGMPVLADTLQLTAISGNPVARVLGSSTTIGKRLKFESVYPLRTLLGTVPASSPSGTRVQLVHNEPNTVGLALPDTTSYNGLCTFLLNANATINGNLQHGYLDGSGSRRFTTFMQNASGTVQQVLFGHPDAFVTWWYQNSGVSPATPTNVQVVVIPSEVS